MFKNLREEFGYKGVLNNVLCNYTEKHCLHIVSLFSRLIKGLDIARAVSTGACKVSGWMVKKVSLYIHACTTYIREFYVVDA